MYDRTPSRSYSGGYVELISTPLPKFSALNLQSIQRHRRPNLTYFIPLLRFVPILTHHVFVETQISVPFLPTRLAEYTWIHNRAVSLHRTTSDVTRVVQSRSEEDPLFPINPRSVQEDHLSTSSLSRRNVFRPFWTSVDLKIIRLNFWSVDSPIKRYWFSNSTEFSVLNDHLEELLQRRHHLASAVRRDLLDSSATSTRHPCGHKRPHTKKSSNLHRFTRRRYSSEICTLDSFYCKISSSILHHQKLLIPHEPRYPLSLSPISSLLTILTDTSKVKWSISRLTSITPLFFHFCRYVVDARRDQFASSSSACSKTFWHKSLVYSPSFVLHFTYNNFERVFWMTTVVTALQVHCLNADTPFVHFSED